MESEMEGWMEGWMKVDSHTPSRRKCTRKTDGWRKIRNTDHRNWKTFPLLVRCLVKIIIIIKEQSPDFSNAHSNFSRTMQIIYHLWSD